MMERLVYLTLGDVVAMHEYIMTRLGAIPEALRDEGGLESALMRPRQAAHYKQVDTVRQAALLAVGISQAHAFVDGNKRTAFQALDVFLWINGVEFVGDPMGLADWLVAVAERSHELAAATNDFEAWLRQNVKARS
jgi:death-on-curing protein